MTGCSVFKALLLTDKTDAASEQQQRKKKNKPVCCRRDMKSQCLSSAESCLHYLCCWGDKILARNWKMKTNGSRACGSSHFIQGVFTQHMVRRWRSERTDHGGRLAAPVMQNHHEFSSERRIKHENSMCSQNNDIKLMASKCEIIFQHQWWTVMILECQILVLSLF